MARILVKNGRVVDPAQGIDESTDVAIADGKIEALGRDLPSEGAEIVDASGCIVAPGFIDVHVHLREPGQEQKETVESGLASAAAGGFTGVACMANTDPVNDSPSVTRYILDRAREAGGPRVYPIAAVSKGLEGRELTEFGELVSAGAVAVSDDGVPVATAQLMRRALEYATLFDIPVIDHCEDMSLSDGAVINESFTSTRSGLRGKHNASEDIVVYRDLVLAELTGGHVHIAHLSTRGAVELVREAKRRGIRVTAEVTPHHLSLTDEAVLDYDTSTKVNPPLRTQADIDALLEGVSDGTIDVIATDHAPHNDEEKAVEYDLAPFGLIGLETAIPVTYDRLVHRGVIDVRRYVEMMSTNPARLLRLKGKGTLKPGVDADVTIVDPEREVTIDATGFRSLSRNTPFDGWKLRGAAVRTIVQGRVLAG